MKFAKDTIATLAPRAGKEDDDIAWDEALPGFGIRFRGAYRSWIVQYRVNGATRRESLGDVRKVGLEAARKAARQRFAQVQLNIDPRAARITAGAALRGPTLATTVARYLDFKKSVLRPASYGAAERYLTKHWQPLATRPLASIARADIANRLQELAKEHGRVSASRARATLAAMLTWATKEGLTETNVAVATNDPGAGAVPRDRVLDASEIKAVWGACGDDMGDFGVIVRLLLLTAQRRTEIGALRWDEVKFKEGLIKLPAARTKGKRQHDVPMSSTVGDILRAWERVRPRRLHADWVFGDGTRPFTTWAHGKTKLDAKIAASGKAVASWTLHDLRRSAATHMSEVGALPHIVECVLNHRSGFRRGVGGTYNLAAYSGEMRAALADWAEHLIAVVEGRETEFTRRRSA